MADAIAENDRRMAAAREADEKAQRELNQTIAENREAHRAEWEETEAAEVHRQTAAAEDVMRSPTPQALKKLGSKPGDARRGPSS